MRVAFVGQSTFFRACALEPGAAAGIDPAFVEFARTPTRCGCATRSSGRRPT
jgi:hypothetical protein